MQEVVATLFKGVNASTIQCKFVSGSNASGCMVVLTSENRHGAQYNLTRNQSTTSAILSVTLEHPSSCYTGVEAFDIESDGSVGSLAISGQLKVHSEAPCTPPLAGSNCCYVQCNLLTRIYSEDGEHRDFPSLRLISPP